MRVNQEAREIAYCFKGDRQLASLRFGTKPAWLVTRWCLHEFGFVLGDAAMRSATP